MGLLVLLLVGLWAFCLLDALGTAPEAVRHLPKAVWVLLIALLSPVGSLLWLYAGRPRREVEDESWTEHPSYNRERRRSWAGGAIWSGTARARGDAEVRPRRASRPRPIAPDDDPEFLRELSERIRRDDDPRA
jgi:hypothetical protein